MNRLRSVLLLCVALVMVSIISQDAILRCGRFVFAQRLSWSERMKYKGSRGTPVVSHSRTGLSGGVSGFGTTGYGGGGSSPFSRVPNLPQQMNRRPPSYLHTGISAQGMANVAIRRGLYRGI